MKTLYLTYTILTVACLQTFAAQNPTITIEKSSESDAYVLQLSGEHTGWQLQISQDLANWSTENLTTGDGTGWKFVPVEEDAAMFFRAVSDADNGDVPGLYDIESYRVMRLEFAQSDWLAQLTANYGTEVNLVASLTVDDVAYEGVGVRFKGDTSYRLATTTKKSFAIEIDATDTELRLLNYKTLNLNNAFSDASFMREVLYSNFCREYIPSPLANFVHLYVNGSDYGVYINAQQENGDFLEEFFQDNDGDRWRAGIAPNAGAALRPPGGGGPGGRSLNFGGDLSWLGGEAALYESGYILKTDKNPDPWAALVNMIDVLNNSAIEELPEKINDVLAVDRFLWMLALENLFLDSDGYLAKAGDYFLYHDINTGRFHPIQHDGNETFNADSTEISGGTSAAPFYGEDLTVERPLTSRLFAIDAYRQRYLAHMRTILNESYHWDYFEPRVTAYAAMIETDVLADTTKQTNNAQFLASVDADSSDLREFVEARRAFLLSHSDVDHESPLIESAGLLENATPVSATPVTISTIIGEGPTASSVTLYYTDVRDGVFASTVMEASIDGSFTGAIPEMLAGTTVYYYVEARANDAVGTVAYFPARAEGAPLTYQVDVEIADETQVVINEIMASNSSTIADADGEFDDWIELANLSDEAIDLSGMYLSDKESIPRKWTIPEGTMIEANGYLLIWADEDTEQAGLHANFKLSSDGETVTLVDTDARGNLLLDSLTYGELGADVSYGRVNDGDTFSEISPSPGVEN